MHEEAARQEKVTQVLFIAPLSVIFCVFLSGKCFFCPHNTRRAFPSSNDGTGMMRSHAAREDWEDGNGGQAGLVIAWWKLPFLRTERVPPALKVFPVCARLFLRTILRTFYL